MIADLIGFEVNGIKVLSYSHMDKKHRSQWNCLCHCGKEFVAPGTEIKRGRIKSCGCLHKSINGLYKSRLYRIHHCMMSRCYTPSYTYYHRYGGRGISVCNEWHDFVKFYKWAIANGYRDDLTIDRIDNDGDYEPSNCRWATRQEQSNNISNNKRLTYDGKTMTISEWSRKIGMDRRTLDKRIRSGWSLSRIFTEPVNHQYATRKRVKHAD